MIPWRAAKRQLILLVFAAVLLLCYFGDMLTRSREAPLSSTLSLRPSKDPNHVDEPQLELVVAATKNENIAWLDSNLRGWLKTVYIVDDTEARPTVPTNKGREAMVYLTAQQRELTSGSYIIDRYDTLPPNVIFHHGERFQWHNDDSNHDTIPLLQRFRVPHLQEQGYVNLRCVWAPGCPVEIRPAQDAKSGPAKFVPQAHLYGKAFAELFPDRDLPEEVGIPCCSQFGVTRATILARPREDYVRFREWLLNTDLDDANSGRVFEYVWHIIFHKKAVHCPDASECYCEQYGMCP